jgi:hypothetical protein
VAKKIEKMKAKNPEAFSDATTEIVRIDTVIKEVRVEGELRIDTIETEKLVRLFIRDTVNVTRFITRFLEVTRDTAKIDTLGVHVFIAGSNVDYSVIKDEQHIEAERPVETITITKTTVVRASWYRSPWFWLLMAVIAVFILDKLGKITIFK